jgi:hypothetical protein
MKNKFRTPMTWLILSIMVTVGFNVSSSYASGINPNGSFDYKLPGGPNSLGINGKESSEAMIEGRWPERPLTFTSLRTCHS